MGCRSVLSVRSVMLRILAVPVVMVVDCEGMITQDVFAGYCSKIIGVLFASNKATRQGEDKPLPWGGCGVMRYAAGLGTPGRGLGFVGSAIICVPRSCSGVGVFSLNMLSCSPLCCNVNDMHCLFGQLVLTRLCSVFCCRRTWYSANIHRGHLFNK